MRKFRVSAFLAILPLMAASASAENYVVLGWNDLGMHCYNRDFQDLAVLPPFNTLWAQVIKVGNPPQIITEGVTVSYRFPQNTYSAGKTNFWTYSQDLFGVNLPADVGLYDKGLSGDMDLAVDHFVAEGIPLTEFEDSNLTQRQPLQLAEITVRDEISGTVLATQTVVAPVSTEMRCDTCHYDGALEDISTGRVETNILTLHDKEESGEYPSGHTGLLMNRRPVLCAECHASNALGAPGVASVPNLSRAMHAQHADKVPQTLDGCYLCHPGPETKCLRGVMSTEHGMDCIDCHGNMENVASNPSPWLNEPRCDAAACHGDEYKQDNQLYRLSKGHGGLYCSACHDSTHAIAPSREERDQVKFLNLQGSASTLALCSVCHSSTPGDPGPHGIRGRMANIIPVYNLLLEKEPAK